MLRRDNDIPFQFQSSLCKAIGWGTRMQLDGELLLVSLLGLRPFSFPYLELCLDPSVICLSLRTCTASQLYPYLILYLTSLAICGPSLDQIIMAGSKGGEL